MYKAILKALKEYNCKYSKDHDGENDSRPLVNILTPDFEATIFKGKKELELLAEHITNCLLFKHKGD